MNANESIQPGSSSSIMMDLIGSSKELTQHETHLQQQPYDVSAWIRYLESVDDLILEDLNNNNNKSRLPKNHEYVQLRDWVGRRAVALLPRSYKLWKQHWEFLVLQQRKQQRQSKEEIDDNDDDEEEEATVTVVLQCFERCLWTLSSYPRVWIAYIEFLHQHPHCISITQMRRIINRALQSLPVTQHEKLWPCILEWIHNNTDSNSIITNTTENSNNKEAGWKIPLETQICLLRRYCLFNPLYRQDFAEFLVQHQQWGDAAIQYQLLLNYHLSALPTPNDSSRVDLLWQAFAELCTQHPVQVEQAGVEWEGILRGVLLQQQHQHQQPKSSSKDSERIVDPSSSSLLFLSSASSSATSAARLEGLLWTQLADSWIRRGSFDIARSVFEQGLQTVRTVRDFSVLYDAYLQFEEGLLEAATQALEEGGGDNEDTEQGGERLTKEPDEGEDSDWDLILLQPDDHVPTEGFSFCYASGKLLTDMELALARAEHLTSRRPLLLNAVVLRQNPNSVKDWLQRADLYLELNLAGQAASALELALQTVQANRTGNTGRPSELVLKLASVYHASMQQTHKAIDLYNRICRNSEYNFAKADDLAECWAAWVELALQQEEWDEALSLARQAVAPGSGPRKLNLTKSVQLWDLLLDLEESLGTVQTTKDAYNRVIVHLKVATVQHVLNFCSFLTEREYFEESFTAYEKGIELFAFPHVGAKVLWKSYLTAFTNRYGGTKVERTRDLFQRCLEECPPEESAEFFLMNGQYEESYGLAKRALSVYQAMCRKLPPHEKLLAYRLFIAKTTKYLGLAATRDIYQEAIDTLKDSEAAKICMEFASMEASLHEVERARAILVYGAQMADPRRLPEYWKAWNEFEIAHGNEETFREMLRVKRSVEAAFSTINYNAVGLDEQVANLTDEQAIQMIAEQEGVETLPGATRPMGGFVPAAAAGSKRSAAAANLDEVEARVAQLRKVTRQQKQPQGEGDGITTNDSHDNDGEDHNDEINIDDIDAEIEEAAASGHMPEEEEHGQEQVEAPVATTTSATRGIETKAIPQSVFGGLKH